MKCDGFEYAKDIEKSRRHISIDHILQPDSKMAVTCNNFLKAWLTFVLVPLFDDHIRSPFLTVFFNVYGL